MICIKRLWYCIDIHKEIILIFMFLYNDDCDEEHVLLYTI